MVTLRASLGTVNLTGYLHITVAKVPTGSPVVWEDWIAVPLTNYNLIIPNLDAENYIISYYEAATNSSLGTLRMQLIVDARTSAIISERRFYTVGGVGAYDPADGDTEVVDPYLIGRNITGFFKEGFRYYQPGTEWGYDDALGKVSVLTGVQFFTDEKVIIELTYSSGTSVASGNGLYSGITDITEATRTLLPSEVNTLCRLVGTSPTQVITLTGLNGMAIDDGFYFDNSCGGVAKCVTLIPAGSKIQYSGFTGITTLDEIWVGKGEHLLLKKLDNNFWEVRTDYKGIDVGELVMVGTREHPMVATENGQLMDGDENPRMWWWLNTVLPSSHKYVTDTIISGSFSHTQNRRGQFALHSTLKKFRMPSTVGLVPKGLSNYESYGADTANRPVDAPGGVQPEMIKKHRHYVVTIGSATSGAFILNAGTSIMSQSEFNGDFKYTMAGNGTEPTVGRSSEDFGASYSFGPQQRVDNNGVIFGRRL